MEKYCEPYKRLILWSKMRDLRSEIFVITEKINKPGNFRLVEQMRSSARSIKQNFVEGYSRNSLKQFKYFCNIAKASLKELEEDVEDCYLDRIISLEDYKNLKNKLIITRFFLDKYIKFLNFIMWNNKSNP